jgi:hypothetical protein
MTTRRVVCVCEGEEERERERERSEEREKGAYNPARARTHLQGLLDLIEHLVVALQRLLHALHSARDDTVRVAVRPLHHRLPRLVDVDELLALLGQLPLDVLR